MIKRFITALLAVAFLVLILYVQGWVVRVTIMIAGVLAQWEMYRALGEMVPKKVRWAGYSLHLLTYPALLWRADASAVWILLILVFISISVQLLLVGPSDFKVYNASVFSLFYPAILFIFFAFICEIPSEFLRTIAIVTAVTGAFCTDILAFFVGIRFGKRKMCPHISPKKTVEGAIGGLAGGVLGALILGFIVHALYPSQIPILHFVALGVLSSLAGQVGDLTASFIKRTCQIKDFSNLLPGHGGILDRLDGLLYSVAVVYCYFYLFIL